MEDFFYKNIILPSINIYKGHNRIKYYNQIKKRDYLMTEELKNLQWSNLKKLLNHCYKNIPYYTELFNSLNIIPDDIKTLKDYSQIPILDKTVIRDQHEKLLDMSLSQNDLIFSTTGGSTGIPLKIYKSKEDQEYGFALRYRSNSWVGWNYWDKSAWVVSDLKRLDELNNFKRKMGLTLRRKLLLDTRKSSKSDMMKWVEDLQQFKPKQVYGYSALLTEFAKFIVENNIKIDGVEGVFSTAEPLNGRDVLNKAFNAPVYDQYGSSEMPCIAHECRHGNMHVNIDEVLVEYEDIEGTNDVKKIICTPLYIKGMPLLRYDIGDTGLPTDKTCTCGLPYPLMDFKVGRISDHFLLSDGKVIPTSAMGWFIAREMKEVKQYKIIQEDFDYFRINLVCSAESRPYNQDKMIKILNNLTQKEDIRYEFEYPDEILPDKNGKFRVTISKVLEKVKK
ncbi:MAG: hypothetical protein WCK67_01995 [bacterium]